MKKCKQCQDLKEESKFRPYYHTEGTYTFCRDCEKLIGRRKYLLKKVELPDHQKDELAKLDLVLGPRSVKQGDLQTLLEARLKKLGPKVHKPTPMVVPIDIPEVLRYWMTVDLEDTSHSAEALQNEVMDKLQEMFRPVLRVQNLVKIYDDTYRDVLNKIQARFDEYEETH